MDIRGIIAGAMTISVNLTEAQQKQLAEIAARLKLSVEQLAEAAIRDLLSRHEDDFEAASKRVLEKNEELYRRLG